MANIETLIEGHICKKHGWAVAEQFRDSYDGSPFDEQNLNALKLIKESVNDVLESDILNEGTQHDLQIYADDLEDYIQKIK